MTRFCIVTPSYNQATFLKQTVESVVSQKGDFELEYLVMDGGSSDGSVELLEQLSKKNPGVFTFFSAKDKGQSDAINKGLKEFLERKHDVVADRKNTSPSASDVNIFAYINSDDYYLRGALEQVAQAFAEHPDSMWAVGDADIVSADGTRIQEPVRWYKRFWRWIYQPWMLLVLNPLPQPAVFVRLETARKIGLFTEKLRYTMDYEYWLRLQDAFGAPLRLSACLSAFRIHQDSKGGSSFENQFREELEVTRLHTNDPVLLALHRLHNALITGVYGVIK